MNYREAWREYGYFEHIGILPGWSWLEENEHKLDDWKPEVEVTGPGFKHKLKVNPGAKGVMKSVMKENRGESQ